LSPIRAAILFLIIVVLCSILLRFVDLFVNGIYDSVYFGQSQCRFWLIIVSFEVCPLFNFVVRLYKWCLLFFVEETWLFLWL